MLHIYIYIYILHPHLFIRYNILGTYLDLVQDAARVCMLVSPGWCCVVGGTNLCGSIFQLKFVTIRLYVFGNKRFSVGQRETVPTHNTAVAVGVLVRVIQVVKHVEISSDVPPKKNIFSSDVTAPTIMRESGKHFPGP